MAQKLVIGPGRLSYPHIFKPQKNERGEDRYTLALLLPPDTDFKPIKSALDKAAVEKFGADRSKWPSKMRKPEDVLQDAEEKYGVQFKGWKYVNAGSGEPPGVVNAMLEDVSDVREAYPGRWARISAAAYGYDNKTKGVTIGLNNVQLMKHDEPLAGKPRAQNDFDVVAEEMGVSTSEDWN